MTVMTFVHVTCILCRSSSIVGAVGIRLLRYSVLACDVHDSTASKVSLLPHQPCSALLCFLHYLCRHVRSASRVRRTCRNRSVNVFISHSKLSSLLGAISQILNRSFSAKKTVNFMLYRIIIIYVCCLSGSVQPISRPIIHIAT